MSILLKLSGEALTDDPLKLFTLSAANALADQIAEAYRRVPDVSLAIMPGGGNALRGSEYIKEMQIPEEFTKKYAANAHLMGMLATCIGAVHFRQMEWLLKQRGVRKSVEVVMALPADQVGGRYSLHKVRSYIDKGKLVVIGGGSGECFRTTDDAVMGKAAELGCDLVLKGTKVNGVFSEDPFKNPNARFFPRMTAQDFLERGYEKIFDLTGIAKIKETGIPVRIFNIFTPGTLASVLSGEEIGTLITPR